MHPDGPIGIFDSGVGGLSVWREIAHLLPAEDTVYFADQIHVPYGPRDEHELRRYADAITRFLLEHGCKAIVVACNTASAAALKFLRETHPNIPTIGMEPAVKPAAAATRTRVIGIMATPATFQGRMFQATAGRYAQDIKLINQICDGLAERIESGELASDSTLAALRGHLTPILAAHADVIVLACTHYPFVIEAIRAIVGSTVQVIDPAPAVARYLKSVLAERGALTTRARAGAHQFYTSGASSSFNSALTHLVAVRGEARRVRWLSSDKVREDCSDEVGLVVG